MTASRSHSGPLRVGIGGPVGSGKTALMEALCKTFRDRFDQVNATLALSQRPAIRLLPSAVVPSDVGIAVEVTGVTPTQFYANADAELETDSDDEGGFCFIKPKEAGLVRLSFEDTEGRDSSVHLLFTEPIDRLINFGKSLVSAIVQFVKDAILMPIAKLASTTPAWDLLIAVLGKNPITGEPVPRTTDAPARLRSSGSSTSQPTGRRSRSSRPLALTERTSQAHA